MDPLPSGWAERQDPKSGRTYYYDLQTKRTQWIRPQKAVAAAKQSPRQTEAACVHAFPAKSEPMGPIALVLPTPPTPPELRFRSVGPAGYASPRPLLAPWLAALPPDDAAIVIAANARPTAVMVHHELVAKRKRVVDLDVPLVVGTVRDRELRQSAVRGALQVVETTFPHVTMSQASLAVAVACAQFLAAVDDSTIISVPLSDGLRDLMVSILTPLLPHPAPHLTPCQPFYPPTLQMPARDQAVPSPPPVQRSVELLPPKIRAGSAVCICAAVVCEPHVDRPEWVVREGSATSTAPCVSLSAFAQLGLVVFAEDQNTALHGPEGSRFRRLKLRLETAPGVLKPDADYTARLIVRETSNQSTHVFREAMCTFHTASV